MMNDYGVKETACTRCIHRDVCSKKDIFMKAQKAADKLDISWDAGNGKIGIQKLSDIDWIGPVELTCKHRVEYKPMIKNMGGLHA